MGTDTPAGEPPAGRPGQAPGSGATTPPDSPPAPAPTGAERVLPATPEHRIEPTRTSMVWTMLVGVVLLAAILVFILQNGQRVRVRFLGASGSLPLGVALLAAALLGAALVLVVGAARVLQLRLVARRHRHADQRLQVPSGRSALPGGGEDG
jgi:uncharacterized integral membrane protein